MICANVQETKFMLLEIQRILLSHRGFIGNSEQKTMLAKLMFGTMQLEQPARKG